MLCVPALTLIVNVPPLFVIVPLPATVMEAPESVFPVSSLTVPVTVPVWAFEIRTIREKKEVKLFF